jgi:hypothetical protein
VPDHDDSDRLPAAPPSESEPIDDVPTVACERCGREWRLDYELEDLRVGNQAVEQFALDHRHHTGHFPDGVTTWQADCRNCPETVERLEESATRRWARTHARHTRHAVDLVHASLDEPDRVGPDEQ